MGLWRKKLGFWRTVSLWLALLTVVLKAAAPAGYMVDSAGPGQISIVLCTGQGGAPAMLDLATGEIHESGDHNQHRPGEDGASKACPFAIAAIAAQASAETGLSAPLLTSYAAFVPAREARPQLLPAGPPLPARGPPQAV